MWPLTPPLTYDTHQFGGVQTEPGAERVPQGPDHGVRQDGPQVVEEEPGRHEVAGVAHYGGQQEEEEERRVQLVQLLLVGDEDDPAQNQTQQDQHAAFRDHGGEALGEVEHCMETGFSQTLRDRMAEQIWWLLTKLDFIFTDLKKSREWGADHFLLLSLKTTLQHDLCL